MKLLTLLILILSFTNIVKSHDSIDLNGFNIKKYKEFNLFHPSLFELDYYGRPAIPSKIYAMFDNAETNTDYLENYPLDDRSMIGVQILRREINVINQGGKIYEINVYRLDRYGKPKKLLNSYNSENMKIYLSGPGAPKFKSNDGRLIIDKRRVTRTIGGGAQGGAPRVSVDYIVEATYTDENNVMYVNP